MTGQIFNIQKFCLHDGPGIRTAVFFKGCNLRCKWCANPESQCLETQFTWDEGKCLHCGRCAEGCISAARRLLEGRMKLDLDLCTGCGACLGVCPTGAIGREGRHVSVQEVVDEAMQDEAFYAHSGGGVTLSGGEVLMQREFAVALARSLHEKGVHVAIETAAAVPPADFKEMTAAVDYVLVDLKHWNNARHAEGTGLGNEQVLENIRALSADGKPFLVRIPVIPGFNDAITDAEQFAALLRNMRIERVQLLPFHQLGERKYDLLEKEYAYSGVKQLHREELDEYRRVFEEQNIRVEL